MRTVRLAVVAALFALTACTGGGTPAKDSTPNPRPSSTAQLSILQPTPGQVVTATSLRVKVKVDGATVLTEASRDIRPDTGHVHLALDSKTITILAGLDYEIKDLTPGPHLLEASFAAADHGQFNPPVLTTVTFTVQEGSK